METAKPNGLGFCGMSGKVDEWIEDWYTKDYYIRATEK
ncbi:MAG: SUMF1/EgtB/PvdO family nonheme iron enzyme, partial [Desulfobulbales bacterium]